MKNRCFSGWLLVATLSLAGHALASAQITVGLVDLAIGDLGKVIGFMEADRRSVVAIKLRDSFELDECEKGWKNLRLNGGTGAMWLKTEEDFWPLSSIGLRANSNERSIGFYIDKEKGILVFHLEFRNDKRFHRLSSDEQYNALQKALSHIFFLLKTEGITLWQDLRYAHYISSQAINRTLDDMSGFWNGKVTREVNLDDI